MSSITRYVYISVTVTDLRHGLLTFKLHAVVLYTTTRTVLPSWLLRPCHQWLLSSFARGWPLLIKKSQLYVPWRNLRKPRDRTNRDRCYYTFGVVEMYKPRKNDHSGPVPRTHRQRVYTGKTYLTTQPLLGFSPPPSTIQNRLTVTKNLST